MLQSSLIPLLLAGCGGTPTGPSSELLGETSETVSAADGATLTVEGVTLEIPAGALSEDTEIIVRVYAPDDTLPDAENLWGNVVVLEPHGLQFESMVLLEIPAPDPLPIEPLSEVVRPGQGVAWLNEDTQTWELQWGRAEPGQAIAAIDHFSTWAFLPLYDVVHVTGCLPKEAEPSEQDWEGLCAALDGTLMALDGPSYDPFLFSEVANCTPAVEAAWGAGCQRSTWTQPTSAETQAAESLLDAMATPPEPTVCEALAESFDPVAPKQATLVDGDAVCPSVSPNDIDAYQAMLDALADEQGFTCSTEVTAEGEPCGLTRTCDDGGDLSATLTALVNGNDDYAGLLAVADAGSGVECTYNVSMEEPEPTWEGTELDTENYYRWYAWGFTESFDFTLLTAYPGAGEGSAFVPDLYLNHDDLFNPTLTYAWDVSASAFRVSVDEDAGVPGFEMLCDYCEVGSALNDCADYDGFEIPVGDPHPHPRPFDHQLTVDGYGLVCDTSDAVFGDGSSVFVSDGGFDQTIRFYR